VGSAEMGFPLRFPENLLDDVRLGYAGGKVPAYVVVEEKYAAWFLGTRSQPALYRYTTNFLENDCSLVYDRANYRIYRRKGLE